MYLILIEKFDKAGSSTSSKTNELVTPELPSTEKQAKHMETESKYNISTDLKDEAYFRYYCFR